MGQASEHQALDRAFEALARYDRGDDPDVLAPIEAAVQSTDSELEQRQALERRLAALLSSSSSAVARTFVCRQLAAMGTSASVPALASLLADQQLSHMARYALERIPGSEADAALRDATGRVSGKMKAGVIQSLGVRRDDRSVSLLAAAMADSDIDVAAAAARALGEIGSPDAANALRAFHPGATGAVRLAVADASLICAERLAASGHRDRALGLLDAIAAAHDEPHIDVAASRARSVVLRR